MNGEWEELAAITRGRPFTIERVRLAGKAIAVEGRFELPPLARLAPDDQVFVMAFVRAHGSIKKMEALFGVSYPTVKNRLNRIAGQFEFVEIDAAPSRAEILERLERGELSVDDAVELLEP